MIRSKNDPHFDSFVSFDSFDSFAQMWVAPERTLGSPHLPCFRRPSKTGFHLTFYQTLACLAKFPCRSATTGMRIGTFHYQLRITMKRTTPWAGIFGGERNIFLSKNFRKLAHSSSEFI
jgi:hypothetical protein